MKHNLLKSVILSVILLMGVSNAWADNGDFYNTYLTYTFGSTNGSAEDSDNGTGLLQDLGTLSSGSFKITAVYLKCWDDGGSNYKSSGGQMCYSKDGGSTQYQQGFSRSNKSSGSNNYEWKNTNANLTIANSTDKSGSYQLNCWFQTWGDNWGDRYFPKNSGNYVFKYKIAPPAVKSFTVTPSGDVISGSGTQADPYIIRYNGSLTLTLSGSQNHTDANSTIQYNTSGAWNTTKSRTISNINSTDIKNVTVKARYKNNSDANLCGTESSKTIYYRSEQIYTVTFDANGHGTAPDAQTVSQGSKATQPTAPTATGYTFGGWYKESNCANAFDFNTAINANITLYAKWTANKYTVTLSNQGATTVGTASVQATYGSAMPSATMPQKTGYTFGGYYTAINGGGTKYYNANGSSAKNWDKTAATTLYAKWTATNYTITYNTNGGNSIAQKTYTIETATFDLPTPTRTGYTFAGWYDNENLTGNKVTQVAKGSTGNKTFYAAWTINQYTLTYSAGEGGSVTAKVNETPIESGASFDYNTSVTLTATPTTGNVFVQWVNENGTTVSTDNPYIFNLTANKTVKAEFAPPTTVYLKPVDFWPIDNARFAIYIWEGDRNKWVEMESVDCEKQYYSANIPSGYTNFKYVRLNPAGKGNASENDGLHFNYRWNETGNLKVQEKMLYTTPRIYLKPNDNWKTDNARFAAYFFEDGKEAEWMSMYKDGDYYYCNMVEGYSKVIFCRMNPSSETNNWENCWNKSADQTIAGNCFTVTAGEWGDNPNDQNYNEAGAKGTWSEHYTTFSTPTYSVTIKPTIHGTYSVVCNGRTYPVSYKEDIVIPNVPMGTVLTIQDVKPNKETEYTSDIVYKESTNAVYETVSDNTITVCGNTTIDENFVTKNAHVVYLRIPNSLADWEDDDHQYLYSYNKLESKTTKLTAAPNASNYETGYTYYTCTIPAGTHTIRFEYHSGGSTLYQTHDFPHVMPLGSLNCYTIHSREGDTKVFNGYWSELLSNGDYRLLYVEQTVEKDANNKTIINRRKAHPSDIIPASIISAGGSKVVSLHIFKDRMYTDAVKKYDGATPTYYESYSNPEVILQQYNCSTKVWEDKERHMVFGPLKTLPGMAMAPGRRNAAADGKLVYDDGIEIIKNDDHQVHPGSGVWNFTVKQLEGNEATIDLTNVTRYTGEYYIRTDVANGGWFNYNPTNHMTRSDEAKANSNFSHYYCKWIGEAGVNVKFTVANDYGYAISDTLEADRTDLWGVALDNKMVTGQTLPAPANVRFAWNEYSNFIHRAYIAGSTNVSDRFLVLEGDANIYDEKGSPLKVSGLDANQQIFRDNSNWIYYADVQMKPMAPVKVTAKYNGQTQYFVGKQDETVSLLQGSGDKKYLIRMLYDFKTNQLISAYVPGASPDVHAISTNLMLIRQNNNEATQLIFNNETPSDMINIPTDRRAYGVIEFTKERLIDDQSLNPYQRSLYWISFPFDVNVAEAICFGEYGKHWIIQEYNGARRAAEGCWLDSESFWDYKWDQNITLEAGKGYVLALDVDQIASDGLFGLAGNRPIGIYFPSTEYISTAITEQTQVSTTVPAHVCTINRNTPKGDRRIADSHWNVIGVPSYRNTSATYSFADIATKPTEVKYYYRWDGNYNAYTAMETTGTQDFHSTHAYMVQFAGQINWTNIFNIHPAAIAAKQSSDDIKEHRLRLEIQQNGNKADHTFVRLQDEDGVTDHFDFNHDLCKIINAGANIYSFVTTETYPIEVAANVLPIQETVIPVGIKLDAAGEYTFAMPDGTDGIVVELIDYETNTTTNLLLDNYTVNLGKGTFDNRFALHVQPSKVTTSVEDINTNSNGVKKYLIDGILYMQKDGVLYDAQGKLVR